MKKILFISNGHGEDLIGAEVAKRLRAKDPSIEITAFPIVGEGKAFEGLNIGVLGPRRSMPSGGFFYQSFWLIAKDLSSGLIGHCWQQIKTMWSRRKMYDLVFGIGDIVPIVLCVLSGSPFMFHGSAKTAYYKYNYTPWEKWLLRKYCLLTFPRDQKTTAVLAKAGIKVKYVGNPMMDCIKVRSPKSEVRSPNEKIITLLPGTRGDARLNLDDLTKAAKEILKLTPEGTSVRFLAATDLPLDPLIEKENFGDAINSADLVIGLSGTGNEQAVGLGKPLVTFPSRGVQHTLKFAKMKQELFGEAAVLLPRNPKIIAKEVWGILCDVQRIGQMRKIGRERMGGAGAVEGMAEIILEALK